jgi:hypothetical protein
LLSFLLNSVTKEVLGQIAIEASVADAWRVITGMFESQSRARIVHLRSKLTSTRKGDLTYTAYCTQMKGFADEMAAASKRLDDEEVICYILAGSDVDFNPFVEAFTAKTDPQTLNDLYSQMLTAEAPVESQKEHQHKEYQQLTVNAAYRGGSRGGRGPFRGRGDGSFHGSCSGCNGGCGGNKVTCQVCGKTGHSALHCYKRIDASYHGEEKHANMLLPQVKMLTLSGTPIWVPLIISRPSWTN